MPLIFAVAAVAGAMRSDGSSFDLVTDAVPHIPAILPYVRPREPQTDISAPPLPGDSFGVLGWHHSRLYLQGLQPDGVSALSAPAVAL